MSLRRAPLFSVALAFATGCVVGLDRWIPIWAALGLFALGGLGWLVAGRGHEVASLALFYALTAAAGLVHTLLMAGTTWPDDLRRLPDDKTYPTTQWRGMVFSEPVSAAPASRRAHDRTTFVFRMQGWRPTGGRYFNEPISDPWRPARGEIECTLTGPVRGLQCGDELEFAAALAPIAAPLVPGSLDDRAFEAEQGIYYRAGIAANQWRLTAPGGGNALQNFSFRARDWAYARLQIGLEDDPRIADFLSGMLIGYRQQIPADIEQDFRRTGTMHVFAVSGQNVAELMVVALVVLQLLGFVRWRWAWILAPVVLAYCLLTGSPASAIRATVMILAILLAWRLGRPLNALACWSLALLAMLIWNPLILIDAGAQLSFGIVLGLILLSPPIYRFIHGIFTHDALLPRQLLTPAQKREEKFWMFAAGLVASALAATVVSEPITAIDFHQVTPISALANLIVIPTAGLITIVGTLAVTFSLITTTWAAWLNNANWLFAKGLILFVGFFANKPGASINVPDIRALNPPCPLLVVAPAQDSACLFIHTSKQTWLFNAGREGPARGAVAHLLQFYGVNRLDGFVLTQVSAADNAGADVIVRYFYPRRVVVPAQRTRSPAEKMLPNLAALSGHPLEMWAKGQSVDFGDGLTADVLNPPAAVESGPGADRSLVLLFHWHRNSLLWAGRLDAAGQARLLAAQPGLQADLLVLDPVHAPSADWLRALDVLDWLEFPRTNFGMNFPSDVAPNQGVTKNWPLEKTGAVAIRFEEASDGGPGNILLSPWAAMPN